MIDLDLERELALLVARAPEPPGIERVRVRFRQRRRRRLIEITTTVVVVVAVGVSGLVALRHSDTNDRLPRIATNTNPAPSTPTSNVTAVDGAMFAVHGAPALGLDRLPLSFNAQISSDTVEPLFTAQSIVVQDVSAPTPGTCWFGYTYGHWRLLLQCGTDAEHRRIHDLLNGAIDANGFLVFHPKPPLVLGHTDGPDVEYGDDAIGIFETSDGPTDCPTGAQVTTHTAGGAAALVDSTGAWWCAGAPVVRVHVADQALVHDALASLQVEDVGGRVRVTSLYGTTFAIDAPGIELGDPVMYASVSIGPLDTPKPAVPIEARRVTPADHVGTGAVYLTLGGIALHEQNSAANGAELVGSVDGWWITFSVRGLPKSEWTTLATLVNFRAVDGYVQIGAVAPLAFTAPDGPDIAFAGLGLYGRAYPSSCGSTPIANAHTSDGYPVHAGDGGVFWCDTSAQVRVDVHPPISVDDAIKVLHVTRGP